MLSCKTLAALCVVGLVLSGEVSARIETAQTFDTLGASAPLSDGANTVAGYAKGGAITAGAGVGKTGAAGTGTSTGISGGPGVGGAGGVTTNAIGGIGNQAGGAITNADAGRTSSTEAAPAGATTTAASEPLPSAGGGASVSASVTDSNGVTRSVSRTSDGQPINVNVGENASKNVGASTGVDAATVTASGPFPSTGGGASVSANVTDSNGETRTVSKTIDGQTNIGNSVGAPMGVDATTTTASAPLLSTGGGTSVSASVTDSNGVTRTMSKTSDGQPLNVNVGDNTGNSFGASTGVNPATPTASGPLPSTSGGASVSATITDSNGKTHSVSKTSDGQSIAVNVGDSADKATSVTATTGAGTSTSTGLAGVGAGANGAPSAAGATPFRSTGVDASTASSVPSNGATPNTSGGQAITRKEGAPATAPSVPVGSSNSSTPVPSKDEIVSQN